MITKDDIINKYGEPDPNKKNMFLNYDIIDSLPDELEPVISEFKFDPKKLDEHFTFVGKKDDPSWYPQTSLMYKIAEMCGIHGTAEKTVEWIVSEIDINPLLMKSFDQEPTIRKMITSVRVAKRSKILCEDGNFRLSSSESNEFDFFTRACLDFLGEEEYTKNYTNNQKYYKYNSSIKRQKRLLELKKFAVQQAETKAFCKTVRVLAGLPTGFKPKDLQDGKLVFMKFIKSKRLQKLETAARIEAIRKGNTEMIEDMSQQLFGTPKIEAPESVLQDLEKVRNNDLVIIDEPEPPKKQNPFKNTELPKKQPENEKAKIKNIIKLYTEKKEDNPNYEILDNTPNALDYIRNIWKNWKDTPLSECKKCLYLIEEVSEIIKIEHDINLND